MKTSLAFSLLVLINFFGCSIIGLGVGISNHEDPEYRAVYHIELLKELTPGTKIILDLNNGKKIKGKFILKNSLIVKTFKMILSVKKYFGKSQ